MDRGQIACGTNKEPCFRSTAGRCVARRDESAILVTASVSGLIVPLAPAFHGNISPRQNFFPQDSRRSLVRVLGPGRPAVHASRPSVLLSRAYFVDFQRLAGTTG